MNDRIFWVPAIHTSISDAVEDSTIPASALRVKNLATVRALQGEDLLEA